MTISASEFDAIEMARTVLNELSSFEEKFYSLCQFYCEVERHIFSSTLEHMVFHLNDVPAIQSTGATFARLMSSFLSAVRLYNDSTKSHAVEISQNQVDLAVVESIRTTQYDSFFEYRLLEAVRNYSQHRSFPVHRSKYGRTIDGDEIHYNFYSDFFISSAKLKQDKKFKASVLAELEQAGEEQSLKDALRAYFACICEMHMSYRHLLAPAASAAQATLNHWREKWAAEMPDPSLAAVAASEFNGDVLSESKKKIYLDPQLDEYRLARAIAFAIEQPHDVEVGSIVVRPTAQG
jgi:hypothetical protein